jgi:hypothetical protein
MNAVSHQRFVKKVYYGFEERGERKALIPNWSELALYVNRPLGGA